MLFSNMLPLLTLGIFVILPAVIGQNVSLYNPGVYLSHEVMILDDSNFFRVQWDFNVTHITFEVLVRTLGYVALGISPNGGMPGSDIVIGWVDDSGRPFLQDRFSNAKSEPQIDTNQDYTLLWADESYGFTRLGFVRPLKLCDEDDRTIKPETIRLIWAFHAEDPPPWGLGASYHSSNRGVRSVFLLDPDKTPHQLPENVITLDFRNRNLTIPDSHTTYWCETFELPKLHRKHHVIKAEAVIQPERESEVHHIVLYACYHDVKNDSINVGHECWHPNMPPDFWTCTGAIYAWGIGGGAFYFPEHVGLPMGYEGGPTLLMMETHYDNPREKSGLIDSSGLRLTLTPDLRRYDAGIIGMGWAISRKLVIPPYMESFRSVGMCSGNCLSQGMGNHTDHINIFAGILHSHLAGHKLKLRHFRGGVEKRPLLEDNNYDFNLQEMRLLEKEVPLYKGDHTLMECFYRTTDRTEITQGGFSTREEMCVSFMLYYPKIPMSVCTFATHVPYLTKFAKATVDGQNRMASPPEYAGKYYGDFLREDIDWENPSTRERFQNWTTATNVSGHYSLCYEGFLRYPAHRERVSYPDVTSPYRGDPDGLCTTVNKSPIHSATVGLVAVLLILLTLCG